MSCRSISSPLLAGLIFLAGCSSPPVRAPFPLAHGQNIPEFTLNGRVAVRHGNDGFSGHLYWRHAYKNDELRLLSPLGQTVAAIQRGSAGVVLEVSGVRHEASNTADLTERVLGWRLPLEGMQYWVQGRASPEDGAEIVRDEPGNVVRLSQQGWEIEYRDYRLQEGVALPYRLVMRGADMELKLAVDEWGLP
ncbi:MAG: lipoprotein insertase outer membrane protein LolB [Sulfuricellaceae bacterium]|nr:lipoprotein insertase outer membrane protein LolB [Sulfuricellaceae bacterium]